MNLDKCSKIPLTFIKSAQVFNVFLLPIKILRFLNDSFLRTLI